MKPKMLKWKHKSCPRRSDDTRIKNDERRAVHAQILKGICFALNLDPAPATMKPIHAKLLNITVGFTTPTTNANILKHCNHVADGVDSDHGWIDDDNKHVQMKAQKLHPPQRRETHQKWWVPSRARTGLKRNLFCIEFGIPPQRRSPSARDVSKQCRPHEAGNKHKTIERCNRVADGIDNDYDEISNDSKDVEMKTQKLHPP